MDSGLRPFEYTSRSVLQQKVEHADREQEEHHIVEAEHQHPATQVLRSSLEAEQRLGGLGGGNQEGHKQRQQQDRHYQLPRTRLGGERGHQRSHGGQAEVGQQQHQEQLGHGVQQVGAQKQQGEGGQRDHLERHQEDKQRASLGHEQGRAIHRRQQQAIDAALLALGREQPHHRDHGGQQQGHPEHPGGQRAVDLV